MSLVVLERINPNGLRYFLEEQKDGTTVIRLKGTPKTILVNEKIENLAACWYMWNVQGKFVQDAFRMLSADQREFIMTGITKVEWDATFGEPEDGNVH